MSLKQQWEAYRSVGCFDESINDRGRPRAATRRLVRDFAKLSLEELEARQRAAELSIRDMGISFTVYSDSGNIDRSWPFDIIPRIVTAKEWHKVSAGLMQRCRALNHFIHDVYNRQRILADGVIPADIVLGAGNYVAQCQGVKPAHDTWAHVCGMDLVRDRDGRFYVLEDNLRVPSGVSYMLENREVTKRVLPELFRHYSILPIDDYPSQLYDTFASLSPRRVKRPTIVVLTPGIYNSAYFEHAFLARGMGAELVEGSDLFVGEDGHVHMRNVDGPRRVDVIYRRIDDEFLDPEELRSDSALGVPGILQAWRDGKVAIANAPGSGVADDKVIYAFVPDMVRYYLDEAPLIDNVKTYLCMRDEDLDYVLKNIDKLVVKPANASGGYGLLVGPHASEQERRKMARQVEKNPRNYIAQPTLALSTAPTLCDGKISPRHLDLRPFVLQGRDNWVTTGGLTRVAMKEGSLVVNSSQGGGSKDTWIVED